MKSLAQWMSKELYSNEIKAFLTKVDAVVVNDFVSAHIELLKACYLSSFCSRIVGDTVPDSSMRRGLSG